MQLGMIGLGRMGSNMVRRLMAHGHECVVYDRNPEAARELSKVNARPAMTLKEFVGMLSKPRNIWIMVPAGQPTEDSVLELSNLLEAGDCVIDGGNSYYKDDVRRAALLKEKGIHFVDAGTSGGVWGLERGYCLMIGGDKEVVVRLDPIFKTLAPGPGSVEKTPGREKLNSKAELGYLHCGPVGAGHFVKMVHNGIEYGIMQAYAEGLDILHGVNATSLPADLRYDLNLADVTEVWRRGSVIGSWLLDLLAMALAEDGELREFSGIVQDSGEGRWTIQAALEEAIPVEVLSAALYSRFRSRKDHTFGEKCLSAMRYKFGGHIELKHMQ